MECKLPIYVTWSLSRLSGMWPSCKEDRNLPTLSRIYINAKESSGKNLLHVQRCTCLTHLTLYGCGLVSVEGLQACPSLRVSGSHNLFRPLKITSTILQNWSKQVSVSWKLHVGKLLKHDLKSSVIFFHFVRITFVVYGRMPYLNLLRKLFFIQHLVRCFSWLWALWYLCSYVVSSFYNFIVSMWMYLATISTWSHATEWTDLNLSWPPATTSPRYMVWMDATISSTSTCRTTTSPNCTTCLLSKAFVIWGTRFEMLHHL